ncbi:imidazolonepropionase-like amidohydrolase [Povalibacter uvarum]|uniref:Imidazolonepropionase-like amidohydrolase n=1 Tax=Povalibacter uvarum TaxID=732238 RepID=A0A841HX46_9GAMM|nr:amidohydrolase family protein [Povalibacter uvarum]MBB6096355.1 imidazolonepropionase-like amidohydrolase [Povalibacter uvarum]
MRSLTINTVCLAGLLTTASVAGVQAAESADRVQVIRAGRLVDVAAGRVLENQVVVIRGERIESVGPAASASIPAGAEVIDLSSSTVLPGIIDTHTHLMGDPTLPPYYGYGLSVPRMALKGAANAKVTLLAGVTTVRDVGSDGYSDVALRDAINDGDVPGPRVLASGPALGITGGHCDSNMLAPEFKYEAEGVANGADAVRTAVRRNVKYGSDVIKYCGTGGVFSKGTKVGQQQYTAEEVAALIDEAHMHGRKVAVHAHGADGIKVAIRAGVDTVEHASLIDDEGIALAKKNGTFLSMDIYNTEYTQAEGPKRGELEEFLRKDREVAQIQRDNFQKAVKAGVKMTFGTDSGVYTHGDNAKQFAVMVKYGMTSMQALQAATVVGADAVGLKGQIGAIAAGHYADIIAVSGNPLTDIHAMETMQFVMKGGQVYLGP